MEVALNMRRGTENKNIYEWCFNLLVIILFMLGIYTQYSIVMKVNFPKNPWQMTLYLFEDKQRDIPGNGSERMLPYTRSKHGNLHI